MTTTRRDFLRTGAGGTALLASGLTLPGFLTRSAAACGLGPDAVDDRILVVVQLSGGNDGLNTVIPYRDDRYHRARPTLRIDPGRVLGLDDRLGLHPELTGFKRLFDDGLLEVITNVGYPNPDRSHFRSMDIWHTGAMQPEGVDDGWLGRVAARLAPPGAGVATGTPAALHLDDGPLPFALRGRRVEVPSIRDIAAFDLDGDADALRAAIGADRGNAADDLLFVQRVAISACANARRLDRVRAEETGPAAYPPHRLAGRLRQIAQLIGADLGPRIYYTGMDGFDTHARQTLAHGPLLRELGDSLAAFSDDLRRRGLADRVLVMTFSEFGRRVHENGSQGTDHGAAAPMFIIGSDRGGVTGSPPDLGALADGDVPHEVDFRRVYASVLDGWLGLDHASVLGRRYDPVGL